MAKYLDENGLLYFWSKIKNTLLNKVDKVEGKGLSTNDYTTAEKQKLSGIEENANNYVLPTATTSILGGVKVDGSTITINGGVISANGGITFQRVDELPETGSTGIIYLLVVTGSAQNVYDEYIWTDTDGTGTMGWEPIGTTAIDLSGYWKKADLIAITNAEIDAIVAS